MSAVVPPGWPVEVPPPGTGGWQRRAVAWLLDLCPPDYRGHPVLARQPRLLAFLAQQHVTASLEAVARSTASVRGELAGQVPPPVVEEAMQVLDAEQARLLAARRAVLLVRQALSGGTFVPRL